MSCRRNHYEENRQRQTFGDVKVTNLTLAMMEGRGGKRRAALWPSVRSATLNRELATLKQMLLQE